MYRRGRLDGIMYVRGLVAGIMYRRGLVARILYRRGLVAGIMYRRGLVARILYRRGLVASILYRRSLQKVDCLQLCECWRKVSELLGKEFTTAHIRRTHHSESRYPLYLLRCRFSTFHMPTWACEMFSTAQLCGFRRLHKSSLGSPIHFRLKT